MYGLDVARVAEYVRTMLAAVGVDPELLDAAALADAHASSGGSVRRLNSVVFNALTIGAQQRVRAIDDEMVRCATDKLVLLRGAGMNEVGWLAKCLLSYDGDRPVRVTVRFSDIGWEVADWAFGTSKPRRSPRDLRRRLGSRLRLPGRDQAPQARGGHGRLLQLRGVGVPHRTICGSAPDARSRAFCTYLPKCNNVT